MKKALFTLSHKETPADVGWEILQVGGSKEDISSFRDNTGDNISDMNHLYLETTGIYWIWKNIQEDIKGQCQYRRRLNVEVSDIDNILNHFDIIVASPYHFNVLEQYGRAHCREDLLACRGLVDDANAFDRIIVHGNILYYSNSFICKRETYDAICGFCFSVLDEFVNRNGFRDKNVLYEHAKKIRGIANPHPEITMAEYQMRICGALFERLFTYYILKNGLKIYDCGKYKDEPRC